MSREDALSLFPELEKMTIIERVDYRRQAIQAEDQLLIEVLDAL